MAAALVSQVHGDVLRLVALRTGRHFTGLTEAATFLRVHWNSPSALSRKLRNIDAAFAVVRHITQPSCCQLLEELCSLLPLPPSGPGGASEGAAPLSAPIGLVAGCGLATPSSSASSGLPGTCKVDSALLSSVQELHSKVDLATAGLVAIANYATKDVVPKEPTVSEGEVKIECDRTSCSGFSSIALLRPEPEVRIAESFFAKELDADDYKDVGSQTEGFSVEGELLRQNGRLQEQLDTLVGGFAGLEERYRNAQANEKLLEEAGKVMNHKDLLYDQLKKKYLDLLRGQ